MIYGIEITSTILNNENRTGKMIRVKYPILVFVIAFLSRGCETKETHDEISRANEILDSALKTNDSTKLLIKELDSLNKNRPVLERDTSGQLH
jgi:hypothetical protein